MSVTIDSAERVINGTYGQVWRTGRIMAEVSGFTAKVAKTKEAVNLCGDLWEDTKMTKKKGTGTLEFLKVDSAMIEDEGDPETGGYGRDKIICQLADPASWGAERIALYGVNFDEVQLANWKAASVTRHSVPFTFTGYKLLDRIAER